jgi:transcriptional regulator GlxA family with amidase domain
MKIQIIIFNGFDELDAIAPFEVLKNAAAVGADIQVELVTIDNIKEISTARGLKIKPTAGLASENEVDVLIIPGGGWNNHAPQGTRAEVERGQIPQAILRLHQSGAVVASVCTGAMLVAEAGLLAGRPAITHHQAVEDLRNAGAEIVNARVVDDGDIITAGGVTSGLDLALWLVERYADSHIAHQVEKRMEYERRGTVWRNQNKGRPNF